MARRLVPLIGLLYFVNYLDRSNIAFAKLTMSEELGLNATEYGVAAGVFFVGYLLFQVPSNLALHRFGARRWLSLTLLVWGLLAAGTAFVPDAPTLYGLRFVLGLAEAGLFPGVIVYLAQWFPAAERARVFSLFVIAIPISAVVGSPTSTALMQYGDGLLGLDGWRLMFLVEGLPAVLLAFVTWSYLTDRPSEAHWLSPAERNWLVATLEREAAEAAGKFNWSLRRTLTNPRTLALGFIAFGFLYGLYAISFFLPTIVAGFSKMFGTDFSLVETGLIVAVPFLVGTAAMIVWSRHSDRTQERVRHVAVPMALGGVSIPVALYLHSPFAVMALVTLTVASILCTIPVFWAMPPVFLFGAALAGGIGVINTLGNSSGFLAPYVTGWLSDATGSSRAGLWVVGIVMVLAAITTVALGATPRPDTTAPAPEPVRVGDR
ncbi:MFS transporter [Actinomadura sp. B10D3]|uniref:MFS transporter n=1 Tax=Actinomadura sp. B10D3 TaxID=3153557 RepID=UPI00325DBCA1